MHTQVYNTHFSAFKEQNDPQREQAIKEVNVNKTK